MSRAEQVLLLYTALADAVWPSDEAAAGDADELAGSSTQWSATRKQSVQRAMRAKDRRQADLGSTDEDSVAAAIVSRAHRYFTIDLQQDVARCLEQAFKVLQIQSRESQERRLHRPAERFAKGDGASHLDKDSIFAAVRLLLHLACGPTAGTGQYARRLRATERINYAGTEHERRQHEKDVWQAILAEERGVVNEAGAASEDGEAEDAADDSDAWSELESSRSSTPEEKPSIHTYVLSAEYYKEKASRHRVAERIQVRQHEIEAKRHSILENHNRNRRQNYSALLALRTQQAGDVPRAEHAVLRKILDALDGIPSDTFDLYKADNDEGCIVIAATQSKSAHYDLHTHVAILSKFAESASLLAKLRHFACKHLVTADSCLSSCTHQCLQSLAEELERVLVGCSRERASWDQSFILDTQQSKGAHPTTVASLNRLLHMVQRQLQGLTLLYDALQCAGAISKQGSKTSVSSLLDAIHAAMSLQLATSVSLVPGPEESPADDCIARCLLATFRPAWNEICNWIIWGGDVGHVRSAAARDRQRNDGTADGLFRETYFAHRERSIDPRDARFWASGIVCKGIGAFPRFMQRIADGLIIAGKSVFLLRAMGLADQVNQFDWTIDCLEDDQGDTPTPVKAQHREVAVSKALFGSAHAKRVSTQRSVQPTPGALSRAVKLGQQAEDKIASLVSLLRRRVSDQLIMSPGDGGYDLLGHVSVLHGLFLWQRSTDIGLWADSIFRAMKRGVDVTDYQFLNRVFREDTGVRNWLNLSLVRLRIDRADSSSDKALICRIICQYSIPWPLNYIFTPQVMQTYQDMFSNLMRLEFARFNLMRIGLGRPSVLRARTAGLGNIDDKLSSLTNDEGDSSSVAATRMAQYTISVLHDDTREARRLYSFRRRCISLLDALSVHVRRDTIGMLAHDLQNAMRGTVGFDELISTHDVGLSRIAQLALVIPAHAGDLDRHQHKAIIGAHNTIVELVYLILSASDALDASTMQDSNVANPAKSKRYRAKKENKRHNYHADRVDWGRRAKARKIANEADQACSDGESGEENTLPGADRSGDTSEARDSNAPFAASSSMSTLMASLSVDAEQESTMTMENTRTMVAPHEDLERWLALIDWRLASCIKKLRQHVAALVRLASRSGDADMRDRYSTLVDALEQVALDCAPPSRR